MLSIIIRRTFLSFVLTFIALSVDAAAVISESIIQLDGNEYTIPYYQNFIPEEGSNSIQTHIPYKDFYIKVKEKKTAFVSRDIAAKLYEASHTLAYLYARSPSSRPFENAEIRFKEHTEYLLKEGEDSAVRVNWIRAGYGVGAVGVAYVAGCVLTAGAGCVIGIAFAGSAALIGIFSNAGEYVLSISEQDVKLAVVESFMNDAKAFNDTSEFNRFQALYTNLISGNLMTFDDIRFVTEPIILNDIKIAAAVQGLVQIPTSFQSSIKNEHILGSLSVISSGIAPLAKVKSVDMFGNAVTSGLAAVGLYQDHLQSGEEITNEMLNDIIRQGITFEYGELTKYFSEVNYNRHAANLVQFASSDFEAPSPNVVSTSTGSQVRLKFSGMPAGNTLSVRSNLKSWNYTIGNSGRVFPVIEMGSKENLHYKVTDEDGLVVVNDQQIELGLAESAVNNVKAASLVNGVRVYYSGLPSGFDGVVICQDTSQITDVNLLPFPLPSSKDSCGALGVEVVATKSGSSGSVDFINLEQGKVYHYAVVGYNFVPDKLDQNGDIEETKHYEFTSGVNVSARTDMEGTLTNTNWKADGFHPYRISGTLNVPSDDESAWFDNALDKPLTIDPGVTVHMLRSASKLVVYGTVNAITDREGSKIILFTSDNGSPAAGDWGHIHFTSGSKGDLRNVHIEYGGDGTAALYSDGNPSLAGLVMSNIDGHGIWIRGQSELEVVHSFFSNISKYAIYTSDSDDNRPTGNYTVLYNDLNGSTGNAYFGFFGSGELPNVNGNSSTKLNQVDINAFRIRGGLITKNANWNRNIILHGSVTIDEGVSVYITPGTAIYGNDRSSRLIIKGDLQAKGTPSKRIRFTSDNESPAAGDWGYIHFAPDSTGVMQYADIEYGGDNNKNDASNGQVSAQLYIDSAPQLDNVILRNVADVTSNRSTQDPKAAGIWIRGAGAPVIQNSQIGAIESWGIYSDSNSSGAFEVGSTIIERSGNGAVVRGSGDYVISNNVLRTNTGYGLQFEGSGSYQVKSNLMEGNGLAGYWSASTDATPEVIDNTWQNNGENNALRIAGSIPIVHAWDANIKLVGAVTISAEAQINVTAGTAIYGNDRSSRLIIKGDLQAKGTPSKRIRFTSDNESPAAGDWGYIHFAPDSTGVMQYADIEYGGDNNKNDASNGQVSAQLYIDSAPQLDNVILRNVADVTSNRSTQDPKAAGIWIRGAGAPVIQNSQIGAIESWGIYSDSNSSGAFEVGSTIIERSGNGAVVRGSGDYVISNNVLRTNTGYGLQFEGSGSYQVKSNLMEGNGLAGYWSASTDATPEVIDNTWQNNGENNALRIAGSIPIVHAWDANIKLVGAVTISAEAQINVTAGTAIYGNDRSSRLIIKGDLQAKGTPSKRIRFTSDNESPAAGDWGYIHFAPDSTGVMQYADIEYGGDNNKNDASNGQVSAQLYIDSAPQLDNVILRNVADVTSNRSTQDPKAAGIWIRGAGAPVIQNSQIGAIESWGIYSDSNSSGAFEVGSTIIERSGNGAVVRGSGDYVISNNVLRTNTGYGLQFEGSGSYQVKSNLMEGNGLAGYWSASTDATPEVIDNTWQNNGENNALRIAGSIPIVHAWDANIKLVGAVTISAEAQINVTAGTAIYGNDRSSRLIIKGDLQAKGTPSKRIRFTSDNESPAAGDWGYIHFAPDSTGVMQYADIEYGGDNNKNDASNGQVSAQLYIDSAPQLDNVILRNVADVTSNRSTQDPKAAGIWIRGAGAPLFNQLLIENSESYALYSDVLHYLNFSNALTIPGEKGTLGILSKNAELNVRNTKWFDDTGPYQSITNLNGLGATITGKVLYQWWKGADSDNDGLPDYWEQQQGSDANSANNVSLDLDGDGLSLLDEFESGTDYNSIDTDGDGLSDKWEVENKLNPTDSSDAIIDSDKDGLTNYQESLLGTNIWEGDSDRDGVVDSSDDLPLDGSDWLDFDRDGQGDRSDLDDDNDGLPDTYEFANGLNPKDASDALNDADGDQISNLDEYLATTDPNNSSEFASEKQIVEPSQSLIRIQRGNSLYLKLKYQVSDRNLNLSGLSFRMHFDSNAIEFIELVNYFSTNFVSVSEAQLDSNDFDNNIDTDIYVSLNWQSPDQSWPGEFNGYLATLKLKLLESVDVESTHSINFSALATAKDSNGRGYGFQPSNLEIVEGFAIDLDINGDGVVDGFTDGAIYTRFMLGYPAESIATEEEMTESTRTRQEMYELLINIQSQANLN